MSRKTPTDVNETTLSGKLLIATPSIGDPRFDRTVILLCDHSPEHAMGIVLNQPVEGLSLRELFEQLDITRPELAPDKSVLIGGPVDRDRGFVLHTVDFHAPDSTLSVNSQIALTATKDALEAIASHSPPRRSLLALGYAGWGAGQLEDELAANAWLVTDPDEALIFGEHGEAMWEMALQRMGVTPEHLSAMAGHA
ncbi:MAG: hypothetical protein CMC70_06595 [Flavobacteriaceae bacterium]|nr:hypothetical protein [Flavobacteriaceae bacterium]